MLVISVTLYVHQYICIRNRFSFNMKLLLALLLFFINESTCYLKFATYYQDHMVLQRGPQQAIIWGTSDSIGDTVSVEISGGHGTVTTKVQTDPKGELDGVWKVKLPAITDPGPFTITVTHNVAKISIHDVLFGDVWICSGQSNMFFPISWLFDPTTTISQATNFSDIRVFKALSTPSNQVLQLLHPPIIHWSKPTKASLSSFSAVCWLFAQYLQPHRKYPLGMVESSWGGTSIEAWSSPASLAKCPKTTKRAPHEDNVLWNSMMHPFTSMTIFGALWYQGEANTHFPDRYSCEFPAMIANWREEFHTASMGETDDHFPFGFVQLAANVNSSLVGGFPYIRWAQTANTGQVPNTKMPNTFMAVAMDLPDFTSPHGTIHPRYKEDVARRLVLGARAIAYKENNLEFKGPFPTGFNLNTHSNHLTILYQGAQNTIDIRNNDGFEVCCSWTNTTTCALHDHWAPAPITSHTLHSVTLSTAGCGRRHLVGLRYEFHTSPCPLRKCAVYGRDNDLPAPTFIRTTSFADPTSPIVG